MSRGPRGHALHFPGAERIKAKMLPLLGLFLDKGDSLTHCLLALLLPRKVQAGIFKVASEILSVRGAS